MSIGDTLRKAAGLFVELPPEEAREPTAAAPPAASEPDSHDELDRRMNALDAQLSRPVGNTSLTPPPPAPPRTIDQIARDSAGPNLEDIRVASQSAPGVLLPDSTLDFAALYAVAALPSSPFTAEQTLDLLSSLPASLPLEMKRQTMQVTLASLGKAIGATPESIVADTSRKLAALAAYADDHRKHADDFVSGAEADIAFLLSQVEDKRKAILETRQQQTEISRLCTAEADRLDDVLEFFSLDVPPSRHAVSG